jgi:hypothetical protein
MYVIIFLTRGGKHVCYYIASSGELRRGLSLVTGPLAVPCSRWWEGGERRPIDVITDASLLNTLLNTSIDIYLLTWDEWITD